MHNLKNVLCRWTFAGATLLHLAVSGAPFAQWFDHRLTDGRTVRIWGAGDEYHAVFESADGHALVYNPDIGNYEYVEAGADGTLVPSGIALGHERDGRTRLAAIGKHLRDTSENLKAKIAARIAEKERDTGRAERWKQTKARAAARRQSASASVQSNAGSAPRNAAAPVKIPTEMVGVTLLVDFPLLDANGNVTNTLAATAHPNVTADDLRELVNGANFTKYGNASSCRAYYTAVSGGAFSYTNVVIGWILMPHPRTYYDDATADNGVCGRSLIGDAFDVLAARDDYVQEILPALRRASYVDNSGRLRDDFQIRALNVLFAGEQATTWGHGLWAHSYVLASAQYKKLVVDIDGHDCHFYNYQIAPVTSSPTIHTFCHENGHMVCDFPDLYHYNDVSGGGVGLWDLMCGRTGVYDTHPQYLCAYLRTAMGWVTPRPLPHDGVWVTVSNRLDDVYIYTNPDNTAEYYLIENRQARGYDQEIRASGIAIFRCNEDGDNMYPAALSADVREKFAAYGAATNRLSYEVALEQADGLYTLEQTDSNGDAGDAWKADNPAATYGGIFCPTSIPCARWADGSVARINLSRFSPNGKVMTFWSAPWTATEKAGRTSASSAYRTNPKDLNLALDCDDVVFECRNGAWFGQSDESHDGKSAARSASVKKGDASWLVCGFSGKGTLYWSWKVSCSEKKKLWESADRLSFFNSTNTGTTASSTIRGTDGGWTRRSLTFTTDEPHGVDWRWYKSSSYSEGENCGWVDRVRWVPDTYTGEPTFGTRCFYTNETGTLTFYASLQHLGTNTSVQAAVTSCVARIEIADNPDFSGAKFYAVGAITVDRLASFTIVPTDFPDGTTCWTRLVVENNLGKSKNGRAFTFTSHTNRTAGGDAFAPSIRGWVVQSSEEAETFRVNVATCGGTNESVHLTAEFAHDAAFREIVGAGTVAPAVLASTNIDHAVTVMGFLSEAAVYVRIRATNADGLSDVTTQPVLHDTRFDATDYDRWLRRHGYITREYARQTERDRFDRQVSDRRKTKGGGFMTVRDEYVAGTDPARADDVFQTYIHTVSNGYRLSWTPDLKAARRYTVYGKARLDDAAWVTPTNATHHFFVVRVSLPGENIPLHIESSGRGSETETPQPDAGGDKGCTTTETGEDGRSGMDDGSAKTETLNGEVFSAVLPMGPSPLSTAFTVDDETPFGTDYAVAWDFDGDGTCDSTNRIPTWTFTRPGTNLVTALIAPRGTDVVYRVQAPVIVWEPADVEYEDGTVALDSSSGWTVQRTSESNVTAVAGIASRTVGVDTVIVLPSDPLKAFRVTRVARQGEAFVFDIEETALTAAYKVLRFASLFLNRRAGGDDTSGGVYALPNFTQDVAAAMGDYSRVALRMTNTLAFAFAVNLERTGGRKRITGLYAGVHGLVDANLRADVDVPLLDGAGVDAIQTFAEPPFIYWAGPKLEADANLEAAFAFHAVARYSKGLRYDRGTLTFPGNVRLIDFDPSRDVALTKLEGEASVFAGLEVGAALGWDGRIASAKLFQTTVSPGVRADVCASGTSTEDWGVEMTVRPVVELSFVPFSLDLFARTFTPAERMRTFEGSGITFRVGTGGRTYKICTMRDHEAGGND